MCLMEEIGKPLETQGIGYKVLLRRGGKYFSPVFQCEWPGGEWLTSNEEGFHIYENLKDVYRLRDWLIKGVSHDSFSNQIQVVICQVEYKEAHTWGYGDGGWNGKAMVVIASKARLIEEVE